jgi:hypothetical protein
MFPIDLHWPDLDLLVEEILDDLDGSLEQFEGHLG